MGSSMSILTENPEPRRRRGAVSRGTSTAADSDAAYFTERPHRRPRPSEAPPTGVLTEALGEIAFYYGACFLYHRSVQRQGKAQ